MHKGFLYTAAILGAFTVAMGAFGAHALKALVPEQSLNVYETAVKYQMYHVLAIALTGILFGQFQNQWIKNAGWSFLMGIVLFCGSLYLLTWKTVVGSTALNWVGPITPIGGFFFILAWLQLAWGIKKG